MNNTTVCLESDDSIKLMFICIEEIGTSRNGQLHTNRIWIKSEDSTITDPNLHPLLDSIELNQSIVIENTKFTVKMINRKIFYSTLNT